MAFGWGGGYASMTESFSDMALISWDHDGLWMGGGYASMTESFSDRAHTFLTPLKVR